MDFNIYLLICHVKIDVDITGDQRPVGRLVQFHHAKHSVVQGTRVVGPKLHHPPMFPSADGEEGLIQIVDKHWADEIIVNIRHESTAEIGFVAFVAIVARVVAHNLRVLIAQDTALGVVGALVHNGRVSVDHSHS